MNNWPDAEARAFNDLAPAMAIVPRLAEWPARDKRSLIALMRARGHASGTDYIDRLRRHGRLLHAWSVVAAGTDPA